ncbi:MAG TPA: GGDEF domain-containing protein [Candidatus Omnitrophota bacterium]|nr:GGDEF domain-containing protein [Candidatus Omnitrophota bacterium]
MRRHLLTLSVLAIAMCFVVWQSRQTLLVYYLLSTLWVLPLYYFFKERAYGFLVFAAAAVLLLHGWFFRISPHPRMFGLWLVQALLFSGLCYYRWELKRLQDRAQEAKENIRKSLESFQAKYQTRLSSLRHLEVQVASLMNLFEIARDFSECMDFNTLAEFLLKKLRTELAFEKMQIFLLNQGSAEKKAGLPKIYSMLSEGVREEERALTESERQDFNALEQAKGMVRREQVWYFPIFEGKEMSSVFAIHGIKEEDLARVEVLSAYLVLLIKKIKLYETVRELAIVDELTQVFLRHHFFERLEEELRRSMRFKLPLTVLMLDIDHFKRYNDDFGHLVGDATLKEVADLLKRNLRRVDLVGRYGGEEFVVAMPETRVANAVEVAERIRSNIARYDFQLYNVKTRVTVSQGLIVFDGEAAAQLENVNVKNLAVELIQKADQAMYRAKEEGRNRVCLYKEAKKS